jgi:hypothetical protein
MKTFISVIFALIAAWQLCEEILELYFYRRTGWDFSMNNPGNKTPYFRGDSTDERDIVSNKYRILVARPLTIILLGVISFSLFYIY